MDDSFPSFAKEKSAPLYSNEVGLVPSAVLALFLHDNTQEHLYNLVLTKRSHSVKTHKGQISLPGGRKDPTDDSPVTTALRETHEELGIDPGLIAIRGSSSPLQGLDGSWIYPVVGSCEIDIATIRPALSEVAEVLFVPWPKLTRESAVSTNFVMFGKRRKSWVFETGVCNIWGLTAQILINLDLGGNL